MKNANIHIKLEAPEVISLKRDILLAEKDILESAGYLKRYEFLKKEEFLLKSKIRKDLVLLDSLIKATEAYLPPVEKETAIKESHEEKFIPGKKKKTDSVVEKKKSQIEKEIEDIREKLAALGVSE